MKWSEHKRRVLTTIAVLLHLLVSGDLNASASSLKSSPSTEELSSRFSWDIATDNAAAYNVISMLDLEAIVGELWEETSSHVDSPRQKRALQVRKRVYEKVSRSEIDQAPFSSAVRVSEDCSGTLISNEHVLTAAHCVHDGRRLKFKRPLLKVGISRRNGQFHWKKVSKIYIPNAWKENRGKKKLGAIDADYAVLELKRGHGKNYLTLRKSGDRLSSVIRFNGFPGDEGGKTLWHSSCPVERVLKGTIFLTRCGASQGSSGAGLYTSLGHRRYALTGIVSATFKVERRGLSSQNFTVIAKLTAAKVKKICRWAGLRNC